MRGATAAAVMHRSSSAVVVAILVATAEVPASMLASREGQLCYSAGVWESIVNQGHWNGCVWYPMRQNRAACTGKEELVVVNSPYVRMIDAHCAMKGTSSPWLLNEQYSTDRILHCKPFSMVGGNMLQLLTDPVFEGCFMRLSRLLEADFLVCTASISILLEEGNRGHLSMLMHLHVAQPVAAFVLAILPSRSDCHCMLWNFLRIARGA